MKKLCLSIVLLSGMLMSVQAQVKLFGQIRSATDQAVAQVKIDVLDSNGQLLQSTTTEADGQYVFSDLPPAASYFLKVSRDLNYLDGVSTFDVVSIARHILGVEPFQDPYKIIASDINLTRSITTLDLVEMRRLILGMVDVFPEGTHWIFIPDQSLSGNPAQVFSSLTDLIEVPVNGQLVEFDMKGVKLGDVNFSAIIN